MQVGDRVLDLQFNEIGVVVEIGLNDVAVCVLGVEGLSWFASAVLMVLTEEQWRERCHALATSLQAG